MNRRVQRSIGTLLAGGFLVLAAGQAAAQKAPAAAPAKAAAPAAPATPAAGNGRPAPNVQGTGSFNAGGWRLTAYSCYRGANRLFCDFDLAAVNGTSGQVGVEPFGTVTVVDDGGRITPRHDAYYVAADGSRMQRVFFSATPVRYVMEYDGVSQALKVTLANGGTTVKNVPVIPLKSPIDLGSYLGGGWRLNLYGCYRATNGRLLCDFDLAAINGTSGQTGVQPFSTVSVVEGGGKITGRVDAYFMAADGSRMQQAFFSATPLRYIMEFDNIDPKSTAVGVANGGYQVPNVPVATLDAQTGAVPTRAPLNWPDRTNATISGLSGLLGGGSSDNSAGAAPATNNTATNVANKLQNAKDAIGNLFKKN